MSSITIRTEVRGLDLTLDGVFLSVTRSGEDILPPIVLSDEETDRLRLEMSKALLWEWNQFEELKTNAVMRYRRYLAAWLVMCLAAFSAFVGYPDYYICVALSLLSLFLWWRTAYMERKSEQEAQDLRRSFRPDWSYLRERLQEQEIGPAESPTQSDSKPGEIQ
jgi:general stress protein CsbA